MTSRSARLAFTAPVAALAFLAATAGVSAHTAAPAPPKPAATQQAKAPAKPAADPPAKLPEAVKTAFKTAYPNATIKNVSKEKVDGKDVYEIESVDAGMARDLNYRPDGTLVDYEEQIAEASIPAVVMTALKTRYPKATITRAEKLFKNGAVTYELALKGAGVGEAELTPDGKWISPKAGK